MIDDMSDEKREYFENKERVPEKIIDDLRTVALVSLDTEMKNLQELMHSPQPKEKDFESKEKWFVNVQKRNYAIRSGQTVIRELSQWMSGRIHMSGMNTQEEVDRNVDIQKAFENAMSLMNGKSMNDRRDKIKGKDRNNIYDFDVVQNG